MLDVELNSVKEFQNKFDVILADQDSPISEVKKDHIELNKRLILEEVNETLIAVGGDDIVGIADGCADSIYVIAHAINQLGRVNNKQRPYAAGVMLLDLLDRIQLAFDNEENNVNGLHIDQNLAVAEIIIRGIAATYNIPLDAVFEEVHKSNMSKVWPDGKARKDEGGKIIKPSTYTKADVKGVLEKSGCVTG